MNYTIQGIKSIVKGKKRKTYKSNYFDLYPSIRSLQDVHYDQEASS